MRCSLGLGRCGKKLSHRPHTYGIIKICMTEFDLPDEERERLARRAIWDYLSVGPAPSFGDIEIEALDDWIETASFQPETLRPHEKTNLGWMHMERAWNRIAEEGYLAQQIPDNLTEITRADLAEAADLFGAAQADAPSHLRAHLHVAKLSVPIFRLALLGANKEVVHQQMAQYLRGQHEAIATVYSDYKQTGNIHDVPLINQLIGLRLTTGYVLNTDYLALPAAYRHSNGGGSPYHQWHTAIFDRDNGKVHKIAFSPQGPPDVVLFPPDFLLNGQFPSSHGRGTAEALQALEAWHKLPSLTRPPKSELMLRAQEHGNQIDGLFEQAVSAQLGVFQGYTKETITVPADPIGWYRELTPFGEPCSHEYGGALETGISQLEMAAAEERISPEDLYLLGWMHMEYGTSFLSRDTERTAILGASLERAEDVFAEAKNALPERSAPYYEAAIAEAAARMYKATIIGEDTEEATEIYCGQLTILAQEMLQDYKKFTDKTSPEAVAIEQLLQQTTIYLIATASPDRSHVGLPSSPRQRGKPGGDRGWDFTLWALEGEDSYVPGQFYGRLDPQEDPTSIDLRIITLTPKALGQWSAAQDFRTLRTLIAQEDPSYKFKKDFKALSKATRNVLRIVDAGQD